MKTRITPIPEELLRMNAKKLLSGILLIISFILNYSTQVNGQDADKWQSLEPEIIDRKILVTQHYDKKLYSVLPDTLRSLSGIRGQTWVVLNKVVVPQGTGLKVPQGIRIFFEPDASMLVEGAVEIIGTTESPALLSIIDINEMYIAPRTTRILWKGIKVGKTGKLTLKNVKISGSETGISSEGICDSMVIENVTFSDPGNVSVKYSDLSAQVFPDTPFTLICPKPWVRRMEQRGYRTGSNWFFGQTAVLAAAGVIFTVAGYSVDQKVKVSSTHAEAQGYSNRATVLYNISKGCYIGAGITLAPAVVFKVLSNKKSDPGDKR